MGTLALRPLPPTDALKWFAGKGLRPTFDWRDLWQSSAENAFSITGIAQLDLLSDLHDEIERAIAEGLSVEVFQERAEKILRYHGWWGPAITEDPITGRKREINLGNANRLATIYQTNIASAISAGRAEHFEEVAAQRAALTGEETYLKFVAIEDSRTTEICRSYDGTILPIRHGLWEGATPPLHFKCRSTLVSLSERDIKDFNYKVSEPPELEWKTYRNARTGYTVKALAGVQPGFGRHDWSEGLHRELRAHLEAASPENRRAIIEQLKIHGHHEYILSKPTPPREKPQVSDVDLKSWVYLNDNYSELKKSEEFAAQLRAMPQREGTMWRGAVMSPDELAGFKEGELYEFNSNCSATANDEWGEKIAARFADKPFESAGADYAHKTQPVIFKLEQAAGADLLTLKWTDKSLMEAVIPIGERFHVVSIERDITIKVQTPEGSREITYTRITLRGSRGAAPINTSRHSRRFKRADALVRIVELDSGLSPASS